MSKNSKFIAFVSLFLVLGWGIYIVNQNGKNDVVIVAHRGTSALLPEHSMESKVYAHAIGVDYIEQDLVMTADDQVIVLHDIYLEEVSNVKEVYPDRERKDGKYYAIDFTLDELRKLTTTERFDSKTGKQYYPDRFPKGKGTFRIHTFEEELEVIQNLNRLTNKNVGIYPEIKAPKFHQDNGKDISKAVLNILDRYYYKDKDDKVFVQCFDLQELIRLKNEFQTKLKLVFLVGENSWNESDTDYNFYKTKEGIKEAANHVDVIAYWAPQIWTNSLDINAKENIFSSVVKWSHEAHLKVHTFTLRADELPPLFSKEEDGFIKLIDTFVKEAKVDGFFTDHAHIAINYLN